MNQTCRELSVIIGNYRHFKANGPLKYQSIASLIFQRQVIGESEYTTLDNWIFEE